MKVIALDSTPLGLITQRPGAAEADACREWASSKIAAGIGIIVPEIVDYEVRRELIRAGKAASVTRLNDFVTHPLVTYLSITTDAMKLAAGLWAESRRKGTPTASPKSLDVDVILCAQILSAGFDLADTVIATANVSHLSLFMPAKIWRDL